MRLFVVVVGLAAVFLGACTDDGPTVLVDLKTDFVAGAEFTAVQTLLEGRSSPIEMAAFLGDDFVVGRRVAELEGLARGRHVVVVTLVGADRTPISERRFRLDVSESVGITALLTRDCLTVRCGGGQTCVAGTCAADDCLNIGDPSCPTAECASVSACPGAAACAVAQCDQGACLYSGMGACGTGEYCSPEDGCLAVPDAPIPDAGPDGPGNLAPLSFFDARPNAGGSEGEIKLLYGLPTDTGGAVRLDFMRIPGSVAPADCGTGDVVASITDFSSSDPVTDRVAERWNSLHSYRACFFDAAGGSLTDGTMISEAIRFYNPGPGCLHPPCENVHSTVATMGPPQRVAATLATTGFTGGDIRLADLNGDGNLDVVIATDGVNVIHLGNGDATFGAVRLLGTDSANSFAATTGDFDNDGNQDIVFANRDSPSMVHLGNGDGTFDAGSTAYPDSFSAIFDVETADLNGDTFLDLLFSSFGDLDRLYLGDGSGSFTFLMNIEPDMKNSCVNCLQLRDLDGDGNVDVIQGYNTGTTRMDVFLGGGDATFAAPIPIPFNTGLTPISVRLADIDNDSILDLIVGRSLGGGIYAGIGDGTGRFTSLEAVATRTNSRNYGLVVADFDGDGNADIATSQDNNGVVGYLSGNGDGTFDAQIDLDGGNTYTTTSMEAGDLNGDQKLDFVAGNALGDSLVFIGL